MVFATLAAFACLFQEPKLFSVQLEAEPAERLLPKLGKALNVDLRADDSTKNDVLVVSVHDVQAKDLLDRIAKLDCASWKKDDNGTLILARSKQQENEQLQKEFNLRLSSVGKMKERLEKLISERTVASSADAEKIVERFLADVKVRRDPSTNPEGVDVQIPAPNETLAQRIAYLIPDRVYAAATGESQLVFSDRPNRVQVQLPVNVASLYALCAQERRCYAQIAGSTAWINSQYPTLYLLGPLVDGEMPRKVIVRILPRTRGGYDVVCRIYTSSGSSQSRVSLLPLARAAAPYVQRESAKYLNSISANAKDLLLSLRDSLIIGDTSTVKFTNDECRKRFLDPVKNEPLANLHGAALLALTKEKKQNLVAVLTDQIPSFLSRILRALPEKVVDAENWLSALNDGEADLSVRTDGNWLEVQPETPSRIWTKRLSRSVLKEAYALMNRPHLSLDDLGNLAYSLPMNYGSSPWMLGVRLCASGWPVQLDMSFNYLKLRFWGSLMPAQKLALRSGKKLPLHALTASQVNALSYLLFEPSVMGMPQISVTFSSAELDASSANGFEATEAFPNGISMDAELWLETSDQVRLNVKYARYSQIMDLSELAELIAATENGKPIVTEQMVSLNVENERNTTLVFNIRPGAIGRIVYHEQAGEPEPPVDSWEKLPVEIVQRLKALIQEKGQQYKQRTSL